uniref:Uncharacterized protein n=1 Tax=Setaria viridis TaxID=4556 RepID=A0A4U6V3D9_SETVI|nr:hypothetical protein SEVIR_4G150100v2 [Setaria viridis]
MGGATRCGAATGLGRAATGMAVEGPGGNVDLRRRRGTRGAPGGAPGGDEGTAATRGAMPADEARSSETAAADRAGGHESCLSVVGRRRGAGHLTHPPSIGQEGHPPPHPTRALAAPLPARGSPCLPLLAARHAAAATTLPTTTTPPPPRRCHHYACCSPRHHRHARRHHTTCCSPGPPPPLPPVQKKRGRGREMGEEGERGGASTPATTARCSVATTPHTARPAHHRRHHLCKKKGRGREIGVEGERGGVHSCRCQTPLPHAPLRCLAPHPTARPSLPVRGERRGKGRGSRGGGRGRERKGEGAVAAREGGGGDGRVKGGSGSERGRGRGHRRWEGGGQLGRGREKKRVGGQGRERKGEGVAALEWRGRWRGEEGSGRAKVGR